MTTNRSPHPRQPAPDTLYDVVRYHPRGNAPLQTMWWGSRREVLMTTAIWDVARTVAKIWDAEIEEHDVSL